MVGALVITYMQEVLDAYSVIIQNHKITTKIHTSKNRQATHFSLCYSYVVGPHDNRYNHNCFEYLHPHQRIYYWVYDFYVVNVVMGLVLGLQQQENFHLIVESGALRRTL